ncbi:unnamed protein product [Rotaria sordida]|uniref:Uncharacterized protein n=1 Tax=Rotaria sordida TaxID=392033 RepID=A0A814XIG1_9BILA|nr:unnamed protein product [Rotaria sordida]CAF0998305.1 unnamed protein product [Rotaria sordida]CAF1015966.1 unnamed protein product [Rotaria sordida]CAF1054492.1 unnamed protein product [Rotaria sordida]CAF1216256.1 unnamed protein product [Rotaria sordida]
MTTNANHFDREDFRCGVCRQKGAFHCEHDTPYRDIYLGTFDPKELRNIVINTEKPKNRSKTYDNSTSNGINSNTNVQYQQSKQFKTTSTTNQNATKNIEQDKKSKSCTIL